MFVTTLETPGFVGWGGHCSGGAEGKERLVPRDAPFCSREAELQDFKLLLFQV